VQDPSQKGKGVKGDEMKKSTEKAQKGGEEAKSVNLSHSLCFLHLFQLFLAAGSTNTFEPFIIPASSFPSFVVWVVWCGICVDLFPYLTPCSCSFVAPFFFNPGLP